MDVQFHPFLVHVILRPWLLQVHSQELFPLRGMDIAKGCADKECHDADSPEVCVFLLQDRIQSFLRIAPA